MKNSTESLQLQQKLIHYKSEVARYKRMYEDNEKQLSYMREKYRSLKNEKTTTEEVQTEKQRIDIIPFFSYTTMLPDSDLDENDVQLLGNFVIKNNGNTPLTLPVICIRIKSEETVQLGGKISNKNPIDDEAINETTERWTYIPGQEATLENGEHWLKPTHLTEIHPGELLSFSQFELTLRSSCVIEGFAYFREIKEGKAALNPIIINF